jgi:hypothetical protein
MVGRPLSPAAERIVQTLAPHTPFAEAIVRRQAERAGLSVATIDRTDLRTMGPAIVAAAAAFVDPDVVDQLKRLLR